jgi:hypothetical protein
MMSIRHLRFRRLWISVGILLLLAVVIGSVMNITPPLKTFMLHDKVLHTLAYACLMGWFAQIYRHDLTRLLLAIGLVMMGTCMEFLQGMTSTRQFDVIDMLANTSGVVLAWALAYTRVGNLLSNAEELFCRKVLRA